jgi:uncharacterized protein
MSISLYAATIPSYLQILQSVSNLVGKAEAFCAEKGLDANDIIQARLAPDMQPFAYQVKSSVVHSLGAIEGVRKGQFSPDMNPPPQTFDALKTKVAETIAQLTALSAAEVDAFIGRDMAFVFGERRVPYTAESFLLSFSQPNFYFHATTAYDILRHKGVTIGKRDFLGQVRAKK